MSTPEYAPQSAVTRPDWENLCWSWAIALVLGIAGKAIDFIGQQSGDWPLGATIMTIGAWIVWAAAAIAVLVAIIVTVETIQCQRRTTSL